MARDLNEVLELRDKIKNDFNRVLPTNELFFDRWEKAKYIGAGEGTSIYDSSLILGDVKIGRNNWVGPFTVLDGTGGGLIIGDYCSISSGVQIYTHDSVKWSLSGGIANKVTRPTSIGDNCYIAPMCIIAMGVEIGRCCVVGANSFVNKSFPEYSIIAGTPAKKIGEVCIAENGDIQMKYYKEMPEEK